MLKVNLKNLLVLIYAVHVFYHAKDAIDLLQGHYIVSVGRDTAATSQKGGLEAIAVSTI